MWRAAMKQWVVVGFMEDWASCDAPQSLHDIFIMYLLFMYLFIFYLFILYLFIYFMSIYYAFIYYVLCF